MHHEYAPAARCPRGRAYSNMLGADFASMLSSRRKFVDATDEVASDGVVGLVRAATDPGIQTPPPPSTCRAAGLLRNLHDPHHLQF